jgi:hypothetical protein
MLSIKINQMVNIIVIEDKTVYKKNIQIKSPTSKKMKIDV